MTPALLLAATLSLTDLQSVNRDVNAEIRPQLEPAGQDVWRISPEAGDCEDYALTKLVRLTDMGAPLSDMSVLIVMVGRQPHAVLAVGERVLDNRYSAVTRRSDYTVTREISAKVALFRARMDEGRE
jgi:predicted transglutaminase-like cysteine proteinase